MIEPKDKRLEGVDRIVPFLAARGLTSGEISAHFAEVYGASVSKTPSADLAIESSRR